jgi:hypothetical protein
MRNEINKDFYCSAASYWDGRCCLNPFSTCECESSCSIRHHKHPTPEQYREEYGEDVPDDMALYVHNNKCWNSDVSGWYIAKPEHGIAYYKKICAGHYTVVCACTPFSKPDKDWRPE